MKKFLILIFFLAYSLSSNAHMAHYNKFNKIEMEILKDGEVIGYNYYFFKKDGDKTTVTNQIKFTVKLFGATIFEIEGYGEEKYIKDKYFLMLLPDDLIVKNNCSKSMMAVHKKYNSSVMASMKVNKKEVSRWGIYSVKNKVNKNNFTIKNVVEKPSIKLAPSNNAVIGRYILPKTIFNKLSKLKPGKGGEIHITDAIQSLISENYKFIGHNFSGKYLDCGTMKGYINSTLEISKI